MERTAVLPLHEYNRLMAVNRAITEGKKVFIGSFVIPYESGMHQSYEGLAFTSDEAVIKQSEEIENLKNIIVKLNEDRLKEAFDHTHRKAELRNILYEILTASDQIHITNYRKIKREITELIYSSAKKNGINGLFNSDHLKQINTKQL
ncbi:hypothetical protein SDC9_17651 [bioreactor metagenome]|uniref:Uncharacterized protein n=1 Tax=bioreactor metagenome TaxID=1076179 RepID=A0A644U0A8_9ZZZZ|nr:hypothetical protein [Lentimicrobium sp.]MEA5111711.1 hypothetical protein [Lentimicrobium sp.]